MFRHSLFVGFCILLLNFQFLKAEYEVPEALVEPLSPRGFRVSIPDEPGITLFAFHGHVNKELDQAREGGTFSKDIKSAKNGRWTFFEQATKLKVGDTIYYWLYVIYDEGGNKLGYERLFQEFTVTELLSDKPNVCITSKTTINKITKCTGVIFQDDFKSNQINESSWRPQQFIPTYVEPRFEFCSYRNRPENIFVQNEELFLKPIALQQDSDVRDILDITAGCTSDHPRENCYLKQQSAYILPPTSSGRIKSTFTFKYGRVDIKASLPRGDWIVPDIYLESQSDPKDKLTIAFSRGNSELKNSQTSDEIGRSVLYAGFPGDYKQKRSETFQTNDLHTYSIIWYPDSIKFLADGIEFGSIGAHNFNSEAYLVLGTSVGGVLDFPDGYQSGNNAKPWKNFDRSQVVKFFGARGIWQQTWLGNDVALRVDSVTIAAI